MNRNYYIISCLFLEEATPGRHMLPILSIYINSKTTAPCVHNFQKEILVARKYRCIYNISMFFRNTDNVAF